MTMSTLGDLLPPGQEPAGASAPPPQGKPLGAMLAEKPAGNVIVPGAKPEVNEDEIKKCETLGDLRAKFPELQDPSSGYTMVVERTHPKGIYAGVQGRFKANHDGFDLLDVEGFGEFFKAGTYVVWVEGPSRTSLDPITGHPRILRKAEITHKVPEMPVTPHQSPYATYPFAMPPYQQQNGNSAVELERARSEGKIGEMLAQKALNGMGAQPDNTAGAIASEAVRYASEQSRIQIDVLNRQMEALREQNQALMERLSTTRSEPSTSDNLVHAMLNRGNADVEMMRNSHAQELSSLRASYDDRIERMRSEFEQSKDRARADMERKEERMVAAHEQALTRERTLADDRFRQEREHLANQTKLLEQSHERALRSARDEYQANLERLVDQRKNDQERMDAQHALIVQTKEQEIQRLKDDNERLRDKVERLERLVNMPFQDKLMEIKNMSELLGVLGGGGAPEEKEEAKPDMLEKLADFAQTPVGQMIAAAALQKSGMLPAGAVPPVAPPGPPAPRQMNQGAPQAKKKPRPVQQTAPQPQQTHQQAPPQQAPAKPKQEIMARGEQPLPDEQLHGVLKFLEGNLWQAAHATPPADPRAVAEQLRAFVEQNFPGQDMVSRFHAWMDAANFTKLLDALHGADGAWLKQKPWIEGLWVSMEPPPPDPALAPAPAPAEEPVVG
jgi:hypothetical protein